MATIAQTITTGQNGPVVLARTTMTASDTLTYTQGTGQILTLHNNTAGALTVTINGSAVQTLNIPGYGGTVSTAAGKAVAVAVNQTVLVELDDIYSFLQGTVSLTGGTGIIATLHVA
jgi:hypothetical protein